VCAYHDQMQNTLMAITLPRHVSGNVSLRYMDIAKSPPNPTGAGNRGRTW